MKKQIIFPLIFLIGCVQIFGQTHNDWRGPNRSGVYNETGLLKKWPEKGPELLWSVTGLPKGNSSVAVGNNIIYITGIKGETEVLVAMDMKGNKLWETNYGRAWTESFPESRSTPIIDNERIYVTSGKLDAACIDAKNGKVIWSVKVNDLFEGNFGRWGKAESPVILDNKIFFTPCGDKTTMVALDKMTGATIWSSESIHDVSAYVSPLLFEYKGKQYLVTVTEKNIVALSPLNGAIIWKFDFGTLAQDANIHANTPLYKDGKIYVTSGYNHTSVMLKLSDDGKSVTQLWTDKVLDNHHGGVVLVNNYIYGSNWLNNSQGRWVCLDWNSGKVMYETDWLNKGEIISADGFLYCYEEKNGNIALVKANPEKFELISSFKINMGSGPHWSHPIINNGILYIRHGEALMAYDIKEKK